MKPFNPESTIFTNLALDKIMPSVSPNAWKVLCFAMRKTMGWADSSTPSGRKESDVISISQFREGCGVTSNTTILRAIDECVSRGYLLRTKEGTSFRYRLNMNYEIPEESVPDSGTPTVTESVMPTVTDSVTVTVTESVNTNYNVNSNINTRVVQKKLQTPAGKESPMRSKEELMKSTEDALFRSLLSTQTGYAHYPERIRPVVERMEIYWHFKAPDRKGKQFAFWIASCEEIKDACAEFGLIVLDKLHDDWNVYLDEHGGCAPFTISSPKSLVNAVLAKSAQMRSGRETTMWHSKPATQYHSVLDV